MEPLEALERTYELAVDRASGVKADQMTAPTPCADFDVRALLEHELGALEMFTSALTGEQAQVSLGTDPGAAVRDATKRNLDAWRQPGVMSRTITLPFGEMPAPAVLGLSITEVLVHTWDVAKATGQDTNLDAAACEVALNNLRQAPQELIRSPGVFGPVVECSKEAPLADQLAAFAGRKP